MFRFKAIVARHYATRYAAVYREMILGKALYVDETPVNLWKSKGYVWVFATVTGVFYFYKDSREGSFLPDMLNGFNLSLLRGISAQEISRLRSKGIFTVNQLSYTFRSRKLAKRAKTPSTPHHFALQALAIRERKVFVHGNPTLSCSGTRAYSGLLLPLVATLARGASGALARETSDQHPSTDAGR
jgi:hypothetical protein